MCLLLFLKCLAFTLFYFDHPDINRKRTKIVDTKQILSKRKQVNR
jgi:hypothetical protein